MAEIDGQDFCSEDYKGDMIDYKYKGKMINMCSHDYERKDGELVCKFCGQKLYETETFKVKL